MARLWKTLSHPALLVTLAVLTLLVFIADQALPQLPSALAADPFASSAWLSAISARYPAGALMEALGLFDLARNNIVRLLLALLLVVLLIRILNRFYLAWHTRQLSAAWQILPDTNAYDLDLPQGGDSGHYKQACERSCGRYRHVPSESEAAGEWLGDRNQRFTWFAVLIEIGILVAALALLLNLRTGWQLVDLSLDPGKSLALAPFGNGTVSFDAAGQTLHLCCAPEQTITVPDGGNRFGSLRVGQQEIGSALRVSVLAGEESLPIYAIEQAGNPSPELVVRFPQERSERAIAIPERNLILQIVDTGDNAFQIQALDASSNILLSETIRGAGELMLDGLTLRFEPTVYITFSITNRPWLWLLIPAILLFLAGTFFRWQYPYLRLGILYDADGVAIRWQGQTGAHPTLSEISAQMQPDVTGDRAE